MRKAIIVTGGSRGIGRATALLAAKRGYAVVINYKNNTTEANNVVRQITQAGGEAIAIAADLASAPEVQRLFKTAETFCGNIVALVNNAGILETQTTIEHIDTARLLRVFSTNVFGSFYCAREAARRMAQQNGGNGGSIVNISSIAAKSGSPFEYLDYAATKGAIDTFTIGLAKELAKENIRVNAVRPGIINTEIHASGGEPDRLERIQSKILMERGGTAEEIANTIMWLHSAEASYVTGAIIDVDGGGIR